MKTQNDFEKRLERWDRNRRKWYHLYLFVGVGINFLIYFTKPWGFDPGVSILWGSLFGLAIPLSTMFLLSYIHQKLLGL
ncbi:MAG: hypothetical protein HQK68_10740 [Desulfamplus sp.]|nr:hypothetical protein [Desulfamplus sp.]